jgi:nucleoside-diphosphate-sugar epimerase
LFFRQNFEKFKKIKKYRIWSEMRIFLTGATGFIGSFVAQQLVEQNLDVSCLVRESSNRRWLEGLPVDFHVGSLMQPETYETVLMQSDYVIHLAGVTKAFDPAEFFRGNVDTTRNLLNSILKLQRPVKRFLLVSSQAAVGASPSTEPIDESYPCNPLTTYGKSKYESEQIAAAYQDKVPVTIVRPPVVYGPRDKDVLNLFKSIKMGLNLMVGRNDQFVSIVYVKDLATGIVQAAFSDKSIGKTYFICEETAYYWTKVADLIAGLMDKKYMTIRLPLPVARMIAFFMEMSAKVTHQNTILNREKMLEIKESFWVISPEKAQEDFGYSTRFPLPRGIENTLDWYYENRWL